MEDSWESVKEYATDIISEIRKYDPDNIILVGSPHWDQDLHLVAESPLKGFNNIMYTLHFYAATHKQELRDRAEAAWEKEFPFCFRMCRNGVYWRWAIRYTGMDPLGRMDGK